MQLKKRNKTNNIFEFNPKPKYNDLDLITSLRKAGKLQYDKK